MSRVKQYYEPPDVYEPRPGDPAAAFIAGGVTEFKHRSLIILNPRRAVFPVEDQYAARDQVWWEQHHLDLPGVIAVFWFPTPDPIKTMFDLGKSLGEGRRVVVGMDPNYPRGTEVRLMCEDSRPKMPVFTTPGSLLRGTLDILRTERTAAGIAAFGTKGRSW